MPGHSFVCVFKCVCEKNGCESGSWVGRLGNYPTQFVEVFRVLF